MKQLSYLITVAAVLLAAVILGIALVVAGVVGAVGDALIAAVQNWREMMDAARAVRDGEQPE